MVNKIKMQRFAFPPQIRPAWKRQKSKNMVACEASLFRTAKFGKKIQLSQKINHYHTSETAESCFFVAHESQECNHCALVWQCVPSRHLTPKIPGQKKRGACRVARPSCYTTKIYGFDVV